MGDFASLAVNGNQNVLSLKNGDLTIDNCGANGLTLDGVRTVIVENGNLIMKCSNGYGSSDTTSSWAWIVKNGNIQVSTGVTNLAGVYVSIGTPALTPTASCGGTGNICSVNSQTTTNILRLN
jgi:hypothetical protein